MDEHGEYACITYYERFGSWPNALAEVFGEVPSRSWEHVSDEELLADLCRLRDKFGKRPTTIMVNKHSKYPTTTYYSRFDLWGEALNHAFDDAPADESGDDG